ncbi:hypothetical protein Kpol_1035p38 [Vanderwaltozyma polyspora DSM 70294]|uniref:BZIP domain-containing protein n=1 Tax=Vanderwaltozyma polyspora (strain ATCC 22028 / DSM 70294 / BCRC 21397 / CBS 2163 / NBRC 10782 / NRRL Y-8283 / UCD 57-17) TaxID=436907 RepID=A7TKK3_VANPO|nr:uncharacterized protein Kpol_1035p38 [Vanderwaltozyma polyspora DSM 70294]EDO17225.1 hypothetical protein Kpol_1035p38 [Vanderwaltozyma polyspora DSM 70294]
MSINEIPLNFKSTLPPRKRAKTKEEKEQRRIERILRNRKAAHQSREKKRIHLQLLEKKCNILEKILSKVDNLDIFLQSDTSLLKTYNKLSQQINSHDKSNYHKGKTEIIPNTSILVQSKGNNKTSSITLLTPNSSTNTIISPITKFHKDDVLRNDGTNHPHKRIPIANKNKSSRSYAEANADDNFMATSLNSSTFSSNSPPSSVISPVSSVENFDIEVKKEDDPVAILNHTNLNTWDLQFNKDMTTNMIKFEDDEPHEQFEMTNQFDLAPQGTSQNEFMFFDNSNQHINFYNNNSHNSYSREDNNVNSTFPNSNQSHEFNNNSNGNGNNGSNHYFSGKTNSDDYSFIYVDESRRYNNGSMF